MKISVIIPTHNRPARTSRAIESVLTQSHIPDEVIVVDDASDPPFEFMSTAERGQVVRVVRLEANRGAAGARQVAVEASTGSHVAFLDSDDVWTKDKLASQVEALQRTEDPENVVICCSWDVVDPDSGDVIETRTPVPTASLIDLCSGCWYAPGSTALVSRSMLERVGGLDIKLRRLEDLDLFIKIGLAGGRLAVAPEVGARIERGRNANIADVEPAVHRLEHRYLGEYSPLSEAEQRRLRAWLDVELAAGNYFDRRWTRVGYYMARSWVRAPRRTIQLGRWWD